MTNLRLSRFALSVTALVLLTILPAATSAQSPPLVDLDAASLADGALRSWKNAGSIAGEFTAADDAAPSVATVGDRRAVTFTKGKYLGSTFKTPAALTSGNPPSGNPSGGNPFTLAVWAFAPQQGKRDVMVSWASRPNHSAEFGYGPGPDGAFFGWDKSAKFNTYPAPGAWHYIAYTYGDGVMNIYVDGALDQRRDFKLTPKPGSNIYLGTGWNSVDQKPAFGFTGSLSRVVIWDRALSLREIRNAAGWTDPFDVVPANGAITSGDNLTLRWQAGDARAAAFDVRLAEDPAAVAGDAIPAQRVTTAEFRPAVAPGRAYAWRVDQLDADGKLLVKGPVWRFTTDSGPATTPLPRDRVAAVAIDTAKLSWTPGRYAQSQSVYLGESRDAVAAGSAVLAKDLPASTNSVAIPAGTLAAGRTYYWRVEQKNTAGIPPAAGDIWAFRTADAIDDNEITFFVGSDSHYGLSNNAELNRKVIDEMNWLPGVELPAKAGGGIVRTPRGVILNGDLLDKGFEPKTAPPAWAEFVRDYGLTGRDGRLAYPMYEGFGNHDGMTGKSVTRAGIAERNKSRVGLTAISENGFHYSWDWGHVHLVQLNLFPGKDSADCIVGPPNHHPEDSLGFLKADLAKHVGDSGRIVVVFCHYCYTGGMADWWTEAAKERAFEVMKPYRVLLIHGHSHGAYVYNWKGIPVIADGATARPEGQTGDFMVVRITRTEIHAAQRKLGEWALTWKSPLPEAQAKRAAASVTPHRIAAGNPRRELLQSQVPQSG